MAITGEKVPTAANNFEYNSSPKCLNFTARQPFGAKHKEKSGLGGASWDKHFSWRQGGRRRHKSWLAGTCLSILHSRYSFDSFLHKVFSKLLSRRHFMNFSLKLLHSPGTKQKNVLFLK